MSATEAEIEDWPTVTVVFLAYNRRDELSVGLHKTVSELDYERERLEVIVVDNASGDGTAEMVRRDFPDVRLIERSWNRGVSAWNDGFEIASGDYVLALDDDCYLPPSGLRSAIAAALRDGADLVSFGVKSSVDETYRFDLDEYATGLLTFWGCAVLVRREVLESLGGYDPEIFFLANELEFMLRFYDRGFRHLYLPEIVAVHAKAPVQLVGPFAERPYRFNTRNFGYIAGKLLRGRDAFPTLLALLAWNVVRGLRQDRAAFKGLAYTTKGFLSGLRRRRPVRPEVSHTYRQNFQDFASPRAMARPLRELILHGLRVRAAPSGALSRRSDWLAEHARFYPQRRGVLRL